jgi:hypothetical protein
LVVVPNDVLDRCVLIENGLEVMLVNDVSDLGKRESAGIVCARASVGRASKRALWISNQLWPDFDVLSKIARTPGVVHSEEASWKDLP